MAKRAEREIARRLRREYGTPVKRLARQLDVSPGTVSLWVRDIELDPAQIQRNMSRAGPAEKWAEINRQRRRDYQRKGREAARQGDLLHQAGCMLYWAEGSKGRNSLCLTNSDPNMLVFFRRFLRESLGVPDEGFLLRLNVYLGNGLDLEEIEDHWLGLLALSRSALRKHSINHFPTSSSGRKKSLPYGSAP